MADIEKVINDLLEVRAYIARKWHDLASRKCRMMDKITDVLELLKEQETVEGHWIPIESPTGVEAFGIKEMTVQVVRCSVCDAEEDVSFTAYRFCPRCGAKMEGSVK